MINSFLSIKTDLITPIFRLELLSHLWVDLDIMTKYVTTNIFCCCSVHVVDYMSLHFQGQDRAGAYEVCPKSNRTGVIKTLLTNIEIYQSQIPSQ